MPNVIVTNKNEESFSGRFDGKVYTFAPKEPVTIDERAAMHIFAYGKSEAERDKVLIKNGWQKNGTPGDPLGPEAAMSRLKKFIFKTAPADAPLEKPAKKTVPGTAEAVVATEAKRAAGGIGRMSGLVDENGNRKEAVGIMPRGTINLPGSRHPLAPPALPPA